MTFICMRCRRTINGDGKVCDACMDAINAEIKSRPYLKLATVDTSGLATGYNWISSKERLPEDGQRVIYYFKPVGIHVGVFTKEKQPEEATGIPDYVADCFSSSKGFLCDEDVWWLPIPEIPKE